MCDNRLILNELYTVDNVLSSFFDLAQLFLISLNYSYLQLRNAMNSGLILVDFQEGPLHFQPTYKFDKKTDTYDTR